MLRIAHILHLALYLRSAPSGSFTCLLHIAIIMYHAISPGPSPSPLCTDTDTSPPPLPPDSVYTSCYCEENIYLLAQAFTQLSDADSTADDRGPWLWQIYVVFISNGGKTVRDSITSSPPHIKVATAAFISTAPPSPPRSSSLALQQSRCISLGVTWLVNGFFYTWPIM